MKKIKGRVGELAAKKLLIKKGYEIMHQNWTCRWGEIDIIAKKDDVLVFVEVKFRTSDKYGYGHEAITYKKKKSLSRAINFYLAKNNLLDTGWQLDVVSITKIDEKFKFDHFEAVEL